MRSPWIGWSKTHLIEHTGGHLIIDSPTIGRLDRSKAMIGRSSGPQARVAITGIVTETNRTRKANEQFVAPTWKLENGAQVLTEGLEMV